MSSRRKNRVLKFVYITAIALALIGVPYFQWRPPGTGQHRVESRLDIVYKVVDSKELKGDAYWPRVRSPASVEAAPKFPAVLVVHGGSWQRRAGDMEGISRALAESGFFVFNTQYRFAPEFPFPKAVEDVTDAIEWLRKNEGGYPVDTSRISAWGYSAGSELILLAGLRPEANLRAIVAGGTPADFMAWPESPIIPVYVGKALKESPELWRAASPVYHVQEKSPPVFLYHGGRDDFVEPEQMRKMVRALKEKNVPVESFEDPWWGHAGTYLFSKESEVRGIEFLKSRSGMLD